MPKHILHDASIDVGTYLMFRYMADHPIFPVTHAYIPNVSQQEDSHDLISKADKSNSVTLKRAIKNKLQTLHREKDLEEQTR